MSETDFRKALVVSPHPDDAELVVGGAMARWASEGKEVILCVVTNGAMGSNDPAVAREDLISTRRQEQLEAAALMGVGDVVFLGHEDCYVEDSHELRRDLIREIRQHKPQIVVSVDPSTYYVQQWYVNHPDHRKVGEAFLAAVNPGAATLPLYRSELYDLGLQPHQPEACLLAASPAPDYFVDISDFMDVKLAALKAHRSQMDQWGSLEQVVRGMGEWMAAESGEGCPYAEGFKSIYLAVTSGTADQDLSLQGTQGDQSSSGTNKLEGVA